MPHSFMRLLVREIQLASGKYFEKYLYVAKVMIKYVVSLS